LVPKVHVCTTLPLHCLSSAAGQPSVQGSTQTAVPPDALQIWAGELAAQSVEVAHRRQPSAPAVQVCSLSPLHRWSPDVLQSGVQVPAHCAPLPVGSHAWPVDVQSMKVAQ
jgi:hypothetical protein